MGDINKLNISDIFAIDNIVDAQISPDGTQVAFVSTRDHSEGEYKIPASSIWCVPFDGSAAPRRLTYGNHADKFPRWSPDGQTLAFLSDREKADVLQLYVMPLNGGEARRLTDAKAGLVGFSWSPDGKRLAFTATDAPDEAEEARLKNRDDAQHIDHNYKFTRLWSLDLATATAAALTPAEYQVRAFSWYKEGWAVLASETPLMNDSKGWKILSLQPSAAAQQIWQMQFSCFDIKASADAKALAWVHSGSDAESSADELWILPAEGTAKCIKSDYAGGMQWVGWLPDGASLLVAALDSTHHRLAKIAIADGTLEEIALPRSFSEGFIAITQVSISRDGQRFATVLEDGTHPKDVWVGELGGAMRQVSFFNQYLQEKTLGKTEVLRWQAPDGLEIEGVLIYPVGYVEGERYPLVVQAHGGPTWQWLERFMANWHDWGQLLAANGYAVLLPNPRGSAGRGREFAWCNRQNWGIGDFDDVMSGVDAVIARGIADPERLGIGGWSYGGYMTGWAIGHTDRFKAAIFGAGVASLYSQQASDISNWLPDRQLLANPYTNPEIFLRSSPLTYVKNVTAPTLIVHGAADERVRLGQGREMYNALRYLKKPVEMVVYPREPHIFSEKEHQRDLLERVVGWFDRYLKA